MAININQDYSQFYMGTEQIKSYGSNSAVKKDTIVKYQFNTTDEKGNKVMDKMSKEETMKVLNDISSQYGENVIVQFSGDGLAALADSKKFMSGREMTEEEAAAKEARDAAFQSEIKYYDKSANYLPAYSGMYGADKAIATAVENCSKEEQAFVYDIIRQNFLVGNSSSMTEEERQANISLGMKKAEYAAENFISEDNRKSFLEAMESIAKLASSGKADSSGNMDYGVKKGNYLGHGSNLVYTTDAVDVMRTMDSNAYAEYQKINKEDGGINSLKYLTNWYANAVKKNPAMIDKNSVSNRQQSDSISISEEGRSALKEKASATKRFGQIEDIEKLSSTSAYNIMNEFEKIMSEPGEEKGTGTDTFDRYVNKMASAYQLMKDRIEEKYAASDRQKEYYVAADGSTQEMTKERELEMLDEAYEAHSRFMATSTQIWSELQDFKAQINYHSSKSETEKSVTKNQNAGIKEQAYNAFMSAINKENSGISSPARNVLNSIWDYFANIKPHSK